MVSSASGSHHSSTSCSKTAESICYRFSNLHFHTGLNDHCPLNQWFMAFFRLQWLIQAVLEKNIRRVNDSYNFANVYFLDQIIHHQMSDAHAHATDMRLLSIIYCLMANGCARPRTYSSVLLAFLCG